MLIVKMFQFYVFLDVIRRFACIESILNLQLCFFEVLNKFQVLSSLFSLFIQHAREREKKMR